MDPPKFFIVGSHTGQKRCIASNGAYISDDTTTNKTYVWENGDTMKVRFVNSPGVYTLSAYDSNNNFLYTKHLNIEACETPYIPNHFTPNGDGINDTWAPVYSDVCSYITRVFDRRNKLVFENRSTEGFKAWDGTFKDKALSEGTYTYHIQSVNYASVKKNDYGVLAIEAY